MADIAKILVGGASAAVGFIAVSLWGPFSGAKFDYATASCEEKQKFLETKAKNLSRGYKLTKGSASEITNVYVDAESDLVSITVQLKDPNLQNIQAGQVEGMRKAILKSACTLTDRKLLNETNYTLRMRFFKPGGAGNLMTVEIKGETCASS